MQAKVIKTYMHNNNNRVLQSKLIPKIMKFVQIFGTRVDIENGFLTQNTQFYQVRYGEEGND